MGSRQWRLRHTGNDADTSVSVTWINEIRERVTAPRVISNDDDAGASGDFIYEAGENCSGEMRRAPNRGTIKPQTTIDDEGRAEPCGRSRCRRVEREFDGCASVVARDVDAIAAGSDTPRPRGHDPRLVRPGAIDQAGHFARRWKPAAQDF